MVWAHFLRMKNSRILKVALKMKLKRKCTRGRRRSRWEQVVRKDNMQKEGTRQIFGKTDVGGGASYCGHLVYDIMQSGEDRDSHISPNHGTHVPGHKMNLYYCGNLRFCME